MNKFIKNSVTPLAVGIVAAVLVFLDSLIAPLFLAGASFTWIAFVNWTVFFSSNGVERFKAIIGFIIGFISANAIVFIGNNLSNIIDIKLINISIMSIFAVFLINLLVMYFDKAKKLFLDSIPGIFVGIAMTFSGAGQQLTVTSINLLGIIIVYGILGLLCGLSTNFLVKKFNSRLEKK